jgi:hypothetical protein
MLATIAAGPEEILRSFRQIDTSDEFPAFHPFLSTYLSRPMSLLFGERDMTLPEDDNKYLNTILDSENGGGDRCTFTS